MKKAAIELSLNFIVIIIIALVLFGFGINFIYNIISKSNDIAGMTMEELDNSIADLMCSDTEKVCLNKDTLELRPGKYDSVGIKILNVRNNAPQNKFMISVVRGIYVDPRNNKPASSKIGLIEIFPDNRTVTLKANKAKTFGIAFQLPGSGLPKGTYVFDVDITIDPDTSPAKYGQTKKIRIEAI
ncbi:hypothetical protein GF323_03540 [Candidatus Woesearchaeota archaeon]|nr:hypothetical protein [Candidatus Woesearchaeota archaeon]